jgi:hypothetical protein
MNNIIDKVLEMLYPHKEDKYSIKDCAHNRYLNGDYDTIKEFGFELWCKNNPELMEQIKDMAKDGTSNI